jgi:hypothetical protein
MGSEEHDTARAREGTARETNAPVRGNLTLDVSTSSPQKVAGETFSIFVVVRNPFEVPITLYQVRTHIPVELIDMNKRRLDQIRAQENEERAREERVRPKPLPHAMACPSGWHFS